MADYVDPYMTGSPGMLREASLQNLSQQWNLTPATFAHKITRGSWIPARHLTYISAQVASAIRKGNARILLSMPPRHGKSELLSVHTPTWYMENFPTNRVMLASYGADLATGFGRRVRDTFRNPDHAHLLKNRMMRGKERVDDWSLEAGGSMYSIGLGGALTGRGADLLLLDDYIKDIKEAMSEATREYIWDWFTTTAFTRLEPGGSCIIVATRWHTDDLIGRIEKRLPHEGWKVINVPALCDDPLNDLFNRQLDEELFPERFSKARLLEYKRTLGSAYFGALYQGKPVDANTKLTNKEWLKEIEPTNQIFTPYYLKQMKMVRSWDLAATEGGGDYTVGSLMSYHKEGNAIYLMNVLRKQLSPGKVEDLVIQTALLDGPQVHILIEQEPGSSGKALIERYKSIFSGQYRQQDGSLVPYRKVVAAPTGGKNKTIRAQPYAAAAENGQIYYMTGAWNEEYLTEFDEFPRGDYDDQMDTTSAGYTYLTGKQASAATWGRTKDHKANEHYAKVIDGEYSVVEEAGVMPSAMVNLPTTSTGATWGRSSGSLFSLGTFRGHG